ncbi:MAG: hypothetical protein ACJAZ9_000540 [Neolewinella sp.]|jgi:hypothetical protein
MALYSSDKASFSMHREFNLSRFIIIFMTVAFEIDKSNCDELSFGHYPLFCTLLDIGQPIF